MSKVCDICGRGPHKTMTRSHSHIGTKKWQHINLQSKKIDGKTVKICTKCIKTSNKA